MVAARGSQRPTVYDVAAKAGVSIATISRYFREPDKLAESTRREVHAAVAELGYVPSGSARGLASRRTGVLGLCSFGLHEPDELTDVPPDAHGAVPVVRGDTFGQSLYPLFADEVLRGVGLQCTERGYALMIGWGNREVSERTISDVAGRVDGLIVLPGVVAPSMLEHVARRIPVVLVATPPAGAVSLSHVTVDNVAGMRAVTEHLLMEHGLRDLWFFGLKEDSSDGAARFEGFRSALRSANVAVPEQPQIRGNGLRIDAREKASGMVKGTRLPEGIVCGSDQTALGVIDAFTHAGVSVPGRVAVTGFDGIHAGRFVRPALTTVRQPMDMLGQVAVDILVDAVERPDDHAVQRELPVQVVLRESCGCAST